MSVGGGVRRRFGSVPFDPPPPKKLTFCGPVTCSTLQLWEDGARKPDMRSLGCDLVAGGYTGARLCDGHSNHHHSHHDQPSAGVANGAANGAATATTATGGGAGGGGGVLRFAGGGSFAADSPFATRPCHLITVVRDPVTRLVSSWEYCKEFGNDQLCGTKHLSAKDATLEQWAWHQRRYLQMQLLVEPSDVHSGCWFAQRQRLEQRHGVKVSGHAPNTQHNLPKRQGNGGGGGGGGGEGFSGRPSDGARST